FSAKSYVAWRIIARPVHRGIKVLFALPCLDPTSHFCAINWEKRRAFDLTRRSVRQIRVYRRKIMPAFGVQAIQEGYCDISVGSHCTPPSLFEFKTCAGGMKACMIDLPVAEKALICPADKPFSR